jgi:putative lumazine-binding protein
METGQRTTAQYAADASDLAAIRQTAMDYLQGWYEADAERMRRALHPELAKRAILHDRQTGERRFSQLNREQMVEKTAQGGGNDTPSDKRYYEVSILDVCDNVASVKAVSYEYVDYLHVVRDEGRWTIMNVLWIYNPTTH